VLQDKTFPKTDRTRSELTSSQMNEV